MSDCHFVATNKNSLKKTHSLLPKENPSTRSKVLVVEGKEKKGRRW
jgi:hypothetical protein